MALMDEFRDEREALKNGTLKQKISYYWYYYKWYVIITAAVLIFAISFIHEIVTQKEDAFYAVILNSWAQEGSDAFLRDFADRQGINLDEYNVNFDSSLYIDGQSIDPSTMAAVQKLMVYIAASEIDVVAGDEATMLQYFNNETFADLRDALSPEQLEKYEPYFYYSDRKVVAELKAAQETDADYVVHFPDPTKPEEMEDPVPVGLFVSGCGKLTDNYVFGSESLVLGIVSNSPRPETAAAFVDYLFEE